MAASATMPVALFVIPTMAAVVGTVVGRRSRATPLPHPRGWAAMAIAVALVAVAATEPVIGVFAVLVAANLAFGRTERPPLSAYPMFSRPKPRAWSLQVEDRAGALVPVARLGLDPVAARKRFATHELAAREEGAPDTAAARRRAAEAYAKTLEANRPRRGRLATEPLTVCVIDYVLEGDHVNRMRTPLVETAP